MAETHRHDRAVRARPGARDRGRKIVSYGTSSYGYDVRCSDEFKVFTNVHSTVVDPKHFDEKSFVDIKAMSASFRRTPSRLHAPSNTFASRATCSSFASGRVRMPAAGSWST
jgi:deoxycytidine triphosphate deaminase